MGALAFDEERNFIISVSRDNAIFVYDLNRHMVHCEVQTRASPTSVHYCANAKRLFVGLVNGRFAVWDTSVVPIQSLSTIPDTAETSLSPICAIDYHHTTSTAFVGTKEGLTLWNVKYSTSTCWGRVVGQIRGIAQTPTTLVWANSSREVFAGFPSGAVCVFDIDRGEANFVLPAHSGEITKIVWLDAPRRLLTASIDKTLKIWDFPSLQCISIEEFGADSFLQNIEQPADKSSSSSSKKADFLGGDPLTSSFDAVKPTARTSLAGKGLPRPSSEAPIVAACDSDDDLAGWDH